MRRNQIDRKISLLNDRLKDLKFDILEYKYYDEYFKAKYHNLYIHNLKLYHSIKCQIRELEIDRCFT